MPKKKVKTKAVVGDRIHVVIGAKPSRDFASATFDIGMDLMVPEGDSLEETLNGTTDLLLKILENQAEKVFNEIMEHNRSVKKSR